MARTEPTLPLAWRKGPPPIPKPGMDFSRRRYDCVDSFKGSTIINISGPHTDGRVDVVEDNGDEITVNRWESFIACFEIPEVSWVDMGFAGLWSDPSKATVKKAPLLWLRGCKLSGKGRGDCAHAVGLPGNDIPGVHDGPDNTVDEYGTPNGWCDYCWLSEKLEKMTRERDHFREAYSLPPTTGQDDTPGPSDIGKVTA